MVADKSEIGTMLKILSDILIQVLSHLLNGIVSALEQMNTQSKVYSYRNSDFN